MFFSKTTGIELALIGALALPAFGCGDDATGSDGDGGGGPSGSVTGATGGPSTSASGPSTSATMSTSSSGSSSSSTGTGSSGSGIGEWTDAPGACPPGSTQVDITTTEELAAASRGEEAFAGDAPDTCYFLHDGTYTQSTGTLFYVTVGGVPNGNRRVFVGQSRDGVVIRGRASIDDGVGDVTIQNMTFDLTGYSGGGSFNTLSIGDGARITVDHVTFTGDCATGFKGGHVEPTGTQDLLVEACIIENFGQCSGEGHEDHGVYLAAGSNITIRNNVVRQNSSRGIQLYTQGGEYGTLDGVLIERNRIYENGHGDYEDGIVINAADEGTIENLHITRNLIYRNYYSGIRFVGGAQSDVVIDLNTFHDNGAGSSASGRSEINIDDEGGAAGTSISGNVFDIGNTLLNDCYDAASLGFGFGDNFVNGSVPGGDCIATQTMGDPMFIDAGGGDFHPQNAAAMAYGAYAP